jgi:hypothetical protein
LLARALYNQLPSKPPAPLEAVIDGSVKTGTNLEPVKQWCYEASRAIVEQGKAIPARLQERLSLKQENGQAALIPKTSSHHWFDHLIKAIEDHITTIEAEWDAIMESCMPPLEIFSVAYQSEDLIRLGSRFNQVYTSALPWAKSRRNVDHRISIEDALELARQRSTAYLVEASPDDESTQHLILLAAAAYYYANPAHSGKDESIWQRGPQAVDGTRLDGIAQQTIQALRGIGILSELTQLENGSIVRYPGARQIATPQHPIKIVGVWFNYWRFTAAHRGLDVPERMQEVSDEDEQWAKTEVEHLANTKFRGMTLKIRHEDGRAVAYTPQGNIFGYIAKAHTNDVAERITLRFSRSRDGNYLSVIS